MLIQNKNKLYLFDLDGTLIDTSNLIMNSIIKTIKHYSKFKINNADLRDYYKKSPYEIIKKFTGYLNMSDKMKIYWKNYDNSIKIDVKIYPDVIKMLNALRQKNYGIGIVTSLPRTKANMLIKTYLKIRFDVIITYNDTKKHKPNPEPINFAIEKYKERFHFNIVSTIYIGDAKNDILAGRNASISTGLAAWGLSKSEFFKNQKIESDYIFNKPLDLLGIEI